MNLREGNGLVPIKTSKDSAIPYMLVEFPSRFVFDVMYGLYGVRVKNTDKHWNILQARLKGATLQEAGQPYSLGRERVRQIEAKFLRMYANYCQRSELLSSTIEKKQKDHA